MVEPWSEDFLLRTSFTIGWKSVNYVNVGVRWILIGLIYNTYSIYTTTWTKKFANMLLFRESHQVKNTNLVLESRGHFFPSVIGKTHPGRFIWRYSMKTTFSSFLLWSLKILGYERIVWTYERIYSRTVTVVCVPGVLFAESTEMLAKIVFGVLAQCAQLCCMQRFPLQKVLIAFKLEGWNNW